MQRLTAELWDGSAPASDIVSSCNTDELESACSTNQSESDELTQMHLPHDFDHDIADWPRLKRTWRGAFVDPVVERAYKYDVFLPTLGRSMGRVFALMLAFNAVSFASISLRAGDEDEYFYALSAHVVIAAMFFGLSMCFHSKRFCSVPMFLMEPTASALLIVLALFLRWHQLLTPSTACSSNATLMLRLSSFMVLSATYVPLTVPAFAAVAIVSIGIGAALDLHDPDAAGWCPLNLLNLCLAGVASTMCRYYLSDMSRAAWAFRRRVIEEQMRRKETLMEFERARAKRYRERKREQELVRKVEKIEEGKHARSRLIRCVMHDLRSPLLSILNVTKMLVRMDGATPLASEAVHSSIDALCACSTLMECIVSDMLDFERIDSGRLVLVLEPFSPQDLVDAAMDAFGGLATARGVELCALPLQFVAPHEADARCIGDIRRIQQCLNNGISNAIKFTDRGGKVSMHVTMERATQPVPMADAVPGDGASAATDGSNGAWLLRVSVTDTGVGLSPAELTKLLSDEPFTQVGRGMMQGNGGSGLGLTIAQHITRLHGPGCSLDLTSDGHGHGTTFTLHLLLPAAPPPSRRSSVANGALHRSSRADAQLAVQPTAPQASAKRDFPPEFKVLHVEDDAVLRKSMELSVFKKLGVPYACAADGTQALQLVRASGHQAFPLIILDNQMPELSGTATARALRAGGYAGMIVGVTGDPRGSPERAEFEGAGLNDCLEKDSSGVQRIKEIVASFALGA